MGLIDNMNSLRQETQTAVEQLLRTVKTAGTEKEGEEYQERLEEYRTSLLEYQEQLEEYRTSLTEYQERLEALSATEEDQMAAVQVALDLTYIKEELDGIVQRQKEINDKISKIDSTIIEPIKKNYTANRAATVEKLDEVMAAVNQSSKGLKVVLGISLLFNILCAGGLAFIILWILQII